MSPRFQPGIRFEWHDTVPERAAVPALYHHTPFCPGMPEVLAAGCVAGMVDKTEKAVS